jgi:hypothetical protein
MQQAQSRSVGKMVGPQALHHGSPSDGAEQSPFVHPGKPGMVLIAQGDIVGVTDASHIATAMACPG